MRTNIMHATMLYSGGGSGDSGAPAVVFRHFGRSGSRCGLRRDRNEDRTSKIACNWQQAHRSMRMPSMMSVRAFAPPTDDVRLI